MMRSISCVRLLAAAAGLGLLCAGLAVRPAAAQTPTPAASAPSAEELALNILPYRLQDTDLPEGYVSAGISADTPALEAFNAAYTPADGQSALQDAVGSGLLTGFMQGIDPKDATPVRQFAFTVDLYTTAQTASAALHNSLDASNAGPIQADNPPLSIKLGDEDGALHAVVTDQTGLTTNLELIAWRHGRVLFSMAMLVPDATETIDQVAPFAQAADKRAAQTTPPAVQAQAQLPVTSSASTRVDAIFALYSRLPGSDLSPYGLRPISRTVITNTDLILNANDPTATFTNRIAATGRIAAVERGYVTLQGDANDLITVDDVLCATKAGATAELRGPLSDFASVAVDATYATPQPLGDSSVLYHATLTHSDGITSDVWGVVWTRGNVVLRVVSASPTADISSQFISDFAAKVDAYYNRGALPPVLSSPNPATTAPTSPLAPANPVAAKASE